MFINFDNLVIYVILKKPKLTQNIIIIVVNTSNPKSQSPFAGSRECAHIFTTIHFALAHSRAHIHKTGARARASISNVLLSTYQLSLECTQATAAAATTATASDRRSREHCE